MQPASKPHSARPPLEAPEGVAAYAAEGGLVRASFFASGEKSRGGLAAIISVNLKYFKGQAQMKKGSPEFQNKRWTDGQTPLLAVYIRVRGTLWPLDGLAIIPADQDASSVATVSVNLKYVKGKTWIKKGSPELQNKRWTDGQTPPSAVYNHKRGTLRPVDAPDGLVIRMADQDATSLCELKIR